VFTVSLEAFYRVCPDTSATRQIVVFGYPNVNVGPDTSICVGSNAVELIDNNNAGNPAASWLWSTGATTPDILVAEPGIYYVTVKIDGCEASDTVTVQNGCYLDIPNAFTPNGDGVNDYFLPRPTLGKGLATFSMSIFNRWGELIFQTSNTEGRGWDGRFNDVMQPVGVYIYVIDATFIDGEKEHHQGNVTLLQ
jgi:gliding motility-associated-like protein